MKESTKDTLKGIGAVSLIFGAMAVAGMDSTISEDKAYCSVNDNFASVVKAETNEVLFNSDEKNIMLDQKDGHCSIWATDHLVHYKIK